MEREEPVQGRVADNEVTTDEKRQVRANKRNGREQVHDHLSAPVTHLTPRQKVTHERFSHQNQENGATKDPDQFARLSVTAVNQATVHVEIHHDKEHRCPGGVHVTNQPAPWDIAHDVFNRREGKRRVGLVMHHQEDAGNDLNDQHQQRQGAKEIPKIEVLGSVILRQVFFVEF